MTLFNCLKHGQCFCQQMESSVSSGGGLENDTLLVVPPSEKSTHLTEGSIAGIVLGCIAAVVAFSKLQHRLQQVCLSTGGGSHVTTRGPDQPFKWSEPSPVSHITWTCSNLLTLCSPYIYWQAGGSTERSACIIYLFFLRIMAHFHQWKWIRIRIPGTEIHP